VSDWQDPLADDEAARERAARRAEREARRREQQARDSLGERVREEIEERQPAEPQDRPPAEPPPPAAKPPAPRARPAFTPPVQETPQPVEPASPAHPPVGEPTPAEPPAAQHEEPFWDDLPPETPATPAAAGSAPPPRRPPPSSIRRRRAGALIVLGLLIVVVATIGVFLSRRGGDEAPPAEPAKGRKTVEVVVPEGYDRTQIAEVARKAGLKGDYLEATESVKGFDLRKLGAEDAQNLEGLLFPATYEVFKGAKVDALVEKQLAAFETNLAEIDLQAGEDRGYTPYEVVIVASMVEREIAVPEERELAASVIYNRLDEGTPLGIDATVRFAVGNWTEPLKASELASTSPYNTRKVAGLPPGPIGNPGLASLEAATNPADSDFFYFVVKPGSCNEHTFVETEAEFAAAEAEYQAALQAEGGSPTDC